MSRAFTIGDMLPGDWAEVRAIYGEGLATGLAAFRSSLPAWQAWNAGHLPIGRLVARRDGRVVGWAALTPVADT